MEVRSIETIVRALNAAKVEYLIVGRLAPVVSLATLLQMKRVVGRPQDLTDIEELNRAR